MPPPNEPAPVPVQPVEQPIICSPYEPPALHWHCERTTGVWTKAAGRRPARYYYKTKDDVKGQSTLEFSEGEDDLHTVNHLREDVARWRDSRYEGVTPITRELLQHWSSSDRPRRLFFCQIEAVETLIYLAEIIRSGRKPRFNPKFAPKDLDALADTPAEPGLLPLTRLGCKMATGSGKTVVMAMLIAWAFCNRGRNPSDERFASGVLVCAPNLTVKERLQVLRPEREDNYYAAFDIVPTRLRPLMQNGLVLVENWHQFAPASPHTEGGKTSRVVDKGAETLEAFARRVLGDDMYGRMPVMVLNDEAHHCYRPSGDDEKIAGEDRKAIEADREEATVWITGLDRINNAPASTPGGSNKPGIQMCVDLSATPFYIAGSGHAIGSPFPWLVSDFGLMDAIESGITKIPRLPVSDSTGRPEPKYFRLWEHIRSRLQPAEFEPGKQRKPKPGPVWREAEGALAQLAGQWKERFEYMQKAKPGEDLIIPPVLIIVCDNTDIAEEFYRRISGEQPVDTATAEEVEAVEEGDEEAEEEAPTKSRKSSRPKIAYGPSEVIAEFANTASRKHTIRIDTELLAKAESGQEDSRKVAAEKLRRVVATVGKKGEPGEHVRCVVSVAMLTEGWDASNVTHILGLRAFGSQLLCEQVVGRGLRRINYQPIKDPATGKELLEPEYVDVYGIPFTVIPFKGRPTDKTAPEDKPSHYVTALPERKFLEIRFPNVEGYSFAMKENRIRCDVARMEKIEIEPMQEPTATFLVPRVGYSDSLTDNSAPFGFDLQTRAEYYASTHLQAIKFQIAQAVVRRISGQAAIAGLKTSATKHERVFKLRARAQLFPQVLRFVDQYVRDKVDFAGTDPRELALKKYVERIVELFGEAIEPDAGAGESPIIPVLDRYKPFGTSADVGFPTRRPVHATIKSHLNLVVLDTLTWESSACFSIEASPDVVRYVRNDHLDLRIAYEFQGVEHYYLPDFIVVLRNGLHVLFEVKGQQTAQTAAKHEAAKTWCRAVNNAGNLGRWTLHVCTDPARAAQELAALAREVPASMQEHTAV